MSGKNKQVTKCPACDGQIYFKRQPRQGQFVNCYDCDSLLEVQSTSPLKLIWAFEEPFDDDDEFFDDYKQTEGAASFAYDDYALDDDWED